MEPDRLSRHASHEMMVAYLESHDAPCPVCGYNLRGVVLEVCPECQAPITLAIGSEQARLGPWLFAMLSFAMALGFDAVVGMLLVVPIVMSGGEQDAELFLSGSLVTLGLVSVGMLWVLMVRKRAWLAMARRRQMRAAWLIFGAVFVVHLMVGVGFVLLVR
ncbi:MAG: hypothetical protein ACWA5W_01570 [Phycisphaerales bacterium]